MTRRELPGINYCITIGGYVHDLRFFPVERLLRAVNGLEEFNLERYGKRIRHYVWYGCVAQNPETAFYNTLDWHNAERGSDGKWYIPQERK